MVRNIVHGSPHNFNQFRDNKGVIINAFTSNRREEWRRIFSNFECWRVGAPFSATMRSQLNRFGLSFIPEDEAMIFNTELKKSNWEIYTGSIQYGNTFLKSGYFFATEARLVFGNISQNIVNQILYKDIKDISFEKENAKCLVNLSLDGNSKAKILLMFPRTPMLESVLAIFAPPAGKQGMIYDSMDRRANGENFINNFTEFFYEIADENRRIRRGQ